MVLIAGQLAAAELPAFRPAGATPVWAAALESPSRREWVEGRRPPAGLGPRRPCAGAAPRRPLGRSDPSSYRLARAKKRAPAAELLWLPGRPWAAWCCWSGADWRWLASQEGEKTPPLAPTKPQGQCRPGGTERCTQKFPPGARLGLAPAGPLTAVTGPQDEPQTGKARRKLSLRNCPFGSRQSLNRGTAVNSIAIEAVMGPCLICWCAAWMTP